MVVLPQPEGPSSEMKSPRAKAEADVLDDGVAAKGLGQIGDVEEGGHGQSVLACFARPETAEHINHAHGAPGDDERDDGQRRRLIGPVGADADEIGAEGGAVQ